MDKNSSKYKVTAIVSVYNAERFLQACIEDLVAQTIFEQTEVIIIDAHSPQNEQEIALKFTNKHKNIIYFRTDKREGLYTSWNRAIKMATGKYLTNANADDRHAPHAFERMANELDNNPDIALVYANCRITNMENALFNSAPIVGYMHWLPYDHINLLRRCEMGPQPMWRRVIHDKVGLFDENFTVTGDYDMWLRASEHYAFKHIPEELGLYLSYNNNLENQNQAHTQNECVKARSKAVQRFMSADFNLQVDIATQLKAHKYRLERYMENLKNGNSIKNKNKLAYHIYAFILLSAKINNNINMLELLNYLDNPQAQIDATYLKKLLTS